VLKEFDGSYGSRFSSRSEAFEELVRSSLNARRTAVVLAGGPAKWLWAPDAKCYRPLIRFMGAPLIVHLLKRMKASGIGEAVVVGSHEVNSSIFTVAENGSSLGMKIKYVEEKEHNGSAHTLSLAEPHVSGPFAFAACDHYFDFSLSTIYDFHARQGLPATLAVYYGTAFEWTKSSLVRIDGSLITQYWEKPARPESHLIATMTGFAQPEIFDLIEPHGSLDAQFAKLSASNKLAGCLVSGNFANIHSKKDADAVVLR